MFLAWSISLLFISLMQSVNGSQFLNITFLFLLLGAPVVPVFGTVIVSSLTSIYNHINLALTLKF